MQVIIRLRLTPELEKIMQLAQDETLRQFIKLDAIPPAMPAEVEVDLAQWRQIHRVITGNAGGTTATPERAVNRTTTGGTKVNLATWRREKIAAAILPSGKFTVRGHGEFEYVVIGNDVLVAQGSNNTSLNKFILALTGRKAVNAWEVCYFPCVDGKGRRLIPEDWD